MGTLQFVSWIMFYFLDKHTISFHRSILEKTMKVKNMYHAHTVHDMSQDIMTRG
jgi:hypothetical protein